MVRTDFKLAEASSFVQFFSIFSMISVFFLLSVNLLFPRLGLSLSASLIRLFASLILIYLIFRVGERSDIFYREYSVSDSVGASLAFCLVFLYSYFCLIIFSGGSAGTGYLLQSLLDAVLLFLIGYELFTE